MKKITFYLIFYLIAFCILLITNYFIFGDWLIIDKLFHSFILTIILMFFDWAFDKPRKTK